MKKHNIYIYLKGNLYAVRRWYSVPRVGDSIVIGKVRARVTDIIWEDNVDKSTPDIILSCIEVN